MEHKEIMKLNIFPIEKFNYVNKQEEKYTSFSGSPSKHPYEDDKFILICDPLSDHTEFLEFFKKDIISVEEQPHIQAKDGNIINMCRIWVKEGAIALRIQPFIVGKIGHAFIHKLI